MRRTRSLAACLAAFAVVGSLLAVAPASAEAPLRIEVSGTLAVMLPDRAAGDLGDPQPSEPAEPLVVLATDDAVVELADIDATTVETGDEFSGVVEIAPEVADALPSDPSAAEALEASAETETPVAVVEQESVALAAAGPVSARPHIVDVALVSSPGARASTTATAATRADIVQRLSDYWAGQSTGIIPSIAIGQVAVFSLAAGGDACDPFSTWTQAASRFSTTVGAYWQQPGSTQPRHLVVLAGEDCGAGRGLASVGSSVHAGGTIWATHESAFGDTTLVHEFGHNVGLGHANVHVCPEGVLEGTPQASGYSGSCGDAEYYDHFDPMGGGFCAGNVCTSAVTALSFVHRHNVGFVRPGDVAEVRLPTGSTTTTVSHTIEPLGAASGLRSLRVIDPRSGEAYYVELRALVGQDAGAVYGVLEGTGVRVLKRSPFAKPDDLFSTALRPLGGTVRDTLLGVGETLTSRTGGAAIHVVSSGATATVTVTLKASAAAKPKVVRLAGADRYATAVAVANDGFPRTAPVVYVATGRDYPDALAAAPAAAAEGGPLLLTDTNRLPAIVEKKIRALKPGKIVVVGSTGVVSHTVLAALRKIQPNTIRVAGANRYETGRAIIRHAFPSGVDETWIATGRNFPDALSAAAAAGSVGYPVLLVDGARGTLDAASAGLIWEMGAARTRVAGSTGVVTTGIERELARVGVVSRHAGANRYTTSQAINAAAFRNVGTVYLATGANFPDALAGAALAASTGSPLYVVPQNCVPKAVLDRISTWKASKVVLIGGPSVLSPAVANLTRC